MKHIFKLLLLFVIFLFGCSKEPYTLVEATLINNSGKNIKILFYKNGIVQPQDTILLEYKDSFLFAEPSLMRGDIKGRGFFSDYFVNLQDSILIVFDNTYKTTHYINLPDSLSEKHYLFESNRNIGNSESYEFIMIRKKGKSKSNLHFYTFTKADYEFAKAP